jgi:hypothetical protein
LERRLGGLQSWSGFGGEEKNSQLPPELESTIIHSVAHRNTTLSIMPPPYVAVMLKNILFKKNE